MMTTNARLLRFLYASILRLAPHAYRQRWRDAILETLVERAREEASLAFWARELSDVIRTVAREWGRHLRPNETGVRTPPEHARRAGWSFDLASDVRFALRSLARQPSFTLVAVLTLALGIGANTAMFTIVNTVVLKSLPFPEAERLVFAHGWAPQTNRAAVSPPDFVDYRERLRSFEGLAAVMSNDYSVTGGDGPAERVRSAMISHEYFDVLGVRPLLGRNFRVEEEREGRHRVVLISYALWQQRFAGRRDVLNEILRIGGYAYEVVGVMPSGFELRRPAQLWVPIALDAESNTVRRFHFVRLVGRLGDGVSLEQAQTEVHQVAAQLEAAYPSSNEGWSLSLLPLQEEIAGPVREPLLALEAAVALVLLIVCANVAGILLARAAARRSETAVRAALGAGAGRIARLTLTESTLVALAGGVIGIGFAHLGLELFKASVDPRMPRLSEIEMDGAVLAFTAVVSLAVGIVFGLVPARDARRMDLVDALRMTGRVSETRERRRARAALVVAQVAVTLVLLVGAILTLTSLAALQAVDPGFDGDGVVTAAISLPQTDYPDDAARMRFYDRLLERLQALPGVSGVGGIDRLPFSGASDTLVYPENERPARREEDTHAQFRRATESYFGVLGIPIAEGRLFEPTDDATHPRVAIVSERLAERFFGASSALGRRITVDVGDLITLSIVGVVGDVRGANLAAEPRPTLYLPLRQQSSTYLRLAARTEIGAAQTLGNVRDAVAELDPLLPVSELSTMDSEMAAATDATRLQATVLGGFAVTAALLAALGLYGILAEAVLRRRREMGMRMALGASPQAVATLILGRGMRLVATGLGFGLPLAFLAARAFEGQLFGVEATSLLPFVIVSAFLAAVGLTATSLPARRAMQVHPAEVLRAD